VKFICDGKVMTSCVEKRRFKCPSIHFVDVNSERQLGPSIGPELAVTKGDENARPIPTLTSSKRGDTDEICFRSGTACVRRKQLNSNRKET